MKFISYTNKQGNLRIINLNQIIKCDITDFRISIILSNDVDIEINSESDSDLFASLSGFFSSQLEDHSRLYNATS